MYAMCKVIVGSPVPQALEDLGREIEFNPGDVGFEMLYSGYCYDKPGYCGVEIFRFNGNGTQKASEIVTTATAEQVKLAEKLLSESREKLKEWFNTIDDAGEWSQEDRERIVNSIPLVPEVYFVWHTS